MFRSRDVTEDLNERPASTQPTIIPQQHHTQTTNVVVKPQFLSIFTAKPSDEIVNHFATSDRNSVLVFPKKFNNLKYEKFWKKKKVKVKI